MDIPNYDKWKLSSGQDDCNPVCKCIECDEDIFEGEEVLKIEDGIIHTECLEDYAYKSMGARSIYVSIHDV